MSDDVCKELIVLLGQTDARAATNKSAEFEVATTRLQEAGRNPVAIFAMARIAFSPPFEVDLTTRHRAGLLLKQCLRLHWDTLAGSAALQPIVNATQLTAQQFIAAVDAMRQRVLSTEAGQALASTFALMYSNVSHPTRELRRAAASALAQWAVGPTGPAAILVFSNGRPLPSIMCDMLNTTDVTSVQCDAALDVLLAYTSMARTSYAATAAYGNGIGVGGIEGTSNSSSALTDEPGAGLVEALPPLTAYLAAAAAAAAAAPASDPARGAARERVRDALKVIGRIAAHAVAVRTLRAAQAGQYHGASRGGGGATGAGGAVSGPAETDHFADVIPPVLPTIVQLCPLTVGGAPLATGPVQAALFTVLSALANSSGSGAMPSALFRQTLEHVCGVASDAGADEEARQAACAFVEEVVDVPSRTDDLATAAAGVAAALLPALAATALDDDLFEQEAANAADIPPESLVGGRRRGGGGGGAEDDSVSCELARVESVWTLRKAAAFALDCLAMSVQGAVWQAPFSDRVAALLRSSAVADQVTALYALAAIAKGVPDALVAAGCMHDVLRLAANDAAPLLLRVTGMYALSSYSHMIVDAMHDAPHGGQVSDRGFVASDAIAAIARACTSPHVQLQVVALQALRGLLEAMYEDGVDVWAHAGALLGATVSGLQTPHASCRPMAISVVATLINCLAENVNTPLREYNGAATVLSLLGPLTLSLWPGPPGGWTPQSHGGHVPRNLLPESPYVNPIVALDAVLRAAPLDPLTFAAVGKAINRLAFYVTATVENPSELVCSMSAGVALDVLSTAFELTGGAFAAEAARHRAVLPSESVAMIAPVLARCLVDSDDYVRRMAFAAVGDAVCSMPDTFGPHIPDIARVAVAALEPGQPSGVAANAAWALGRAFVLPRGAADAAAMRDAAAAAVTSVARVLLKDDPKVGLILGQNLVILLSRAAPIAATTDAAAAVAAAFGETRNGVSPLLTQWARWAADVHDGEERADLYAGFAALLESSCGAHVVRAIAPPADGGGAHGFKVFVGAVERSLERDHPSPVELSPLAAGHAGTRVSTKDALATIFRVIAAQSGAQVMEAAVAALPRAQQQLVAACLH